VVVHREVGVDVEEPATLGLMQATAVQVGVGDEPADSRQLGQPGDEFGRVQIVDQPADERWEVCSPRLAELLLVVVPVLDPRGLIRPWKLASEPARDGVVEETGQVNVRERRVAPVLLGELGQPGAPPVVGEERGAAHRRFPWSKKRAIRRHGRAANPRSRS